MTRKLTEEKAVLTLRSIPEREGLVFDADVLPGAIVVRWWMPGDRSRVVRVECTRKRTMVALADSRGGLLNLTVQRQGGFELIPLVRYGIDWLTGDGAQREADTARRTAPEAPGRTDAVQGREVDCGGEETGGGL